MCKYHTTTSQPFYGPFSRTTWVSWWCKGRLTEADTPTIWLGTTPSGLTSAHLHYPPFFYRPDALPVAQPTMWKHWRQLVHNVQIILANKSSRLLIIVDNYMLMSLLQKVLLCNAGWQTWSDREERSRAVGQVGVGLFSTAAWSSLWVLSGMSAAAAAMVIFVHLLLPADYALFFYVCTNSSMKSYF